MGRIRNIKPEFGQNEKLSALPAEVHLFAALLLTHADDEGYFNANPRLLHAAVCPLRELSLSIPDILRELSVSGFIELITGSDGRQYGHIVNFLVHQRINRATPSKIKVLCSKLIDDSVSTQGGVSEIVHREGGMEGGMVMEVEGGVGVKSETPPNLGPTAYARALLEKINFPIVIGNVKAVAAAIESEIKAGKTGVAAFEFVLAGTLDARDKNIPINKFFFEDGLYRGNRRNGKRPVEAGIYTGEASCQVSESPIIARNRKLRETKVKSQIPNS